MMRGTRPQRSHIMKLTWLGGFAGRSQISTDNGFGVDAAHVLRDLWEKEPPDPRRLVFGTDFSQVGARRTERAWIERRRASPRTAVGNGGSSDAARRSTF